MIIVCLVLSIISIGLGIIIFLNFTTDDEAKEIFEKNKSFFEKGLENIRCESRYPNSRIYSSFNDLSTKVSYLETEVTLLQRKIKMVEEYLNVEIKEYPKKEAKKFYVKKDRECKNGTENR